jgi:hypothetical protein
MQRADGGKAGGRRSSRASTSARCWAVLAFFGGIAFAIATPLLALVLVLDLVGKSLSASVAMLFEELDLGAGALGTALAALLWWIAYAIWLIIDFEWSRLGWLLLSILGWLLCG